MHSELWLSELRDALAAGYDRGWLEEYLEVVDLEAVDGRRARRCDSIHRLVNSKPWECDEVTLPLKLLQRTGWWHWICREVRRELKLHSGVKSKSREWWDDRQSSVYSALGVNSWWWNGEIERDDITMCSCNDSGVVDEEERDGGWRCERYGWYERTWGIRGTTCLIGFGTPRISVNTAQIGTRTCHIGDGKLTCTQNSLKSQFLMMISPISFELSLSCAQLYHHLRSRSWVIPLYLAIPWSWLNTENSIQQLQHHPKIDSLPLSASLTLPASFPSLGGCCCTQLSTFPQLQVNQWIESQLPSRLPPNRPLPSTLLISLDYSLQVHL